MNILKDAAMLSAAGVLLSGCQSASQLDFAEVKHGVLCLTFDDGVYDTWLPYLDLFRKFDAHATFFYSKEITPEAIASMRTLTAAGHTVGLHGMKHRNAPEAIASLGAERYFELEVQPQLDALQAAGITVHCYAYPNNRYDDASHSLLSPHFRHFRAGLRPHPEPVKGYWIADFPQAFYDLDQIAKTPVLGGSGIGEYYLSTQENLDAALEKAARENKLIVFFSHRILPDEKSINISVPMLEATLRKAQSLGMKIAGFDELP